MYLKIRSISDCKKTVRFRQHSDSNFDTSLAPDIASVDRYHHISTSSFARNGCQWPIFARNAHIALHSRQQTGAECYGTSNNDQNTTSWSIFRGFRIVDLRVQTAVFVVSVKPEVVFRDRK